MYIMVAKQSIRILMVFCCGYTGTSVCVSVSLCACVHLCVGVWMCVGVCVCVCGWVGEVGSEFGPPLKKPNI